MIIFSCTYYYINILFALTYQREHLLVWYDGNSKLNSKNAISAIYALNVSDCVICQT